MNDESNWNGNRQYSLNQNQWNNQFNQANYNPGQTMISNKKTKKWHIIAGVALIIWILSLYGSIGNLRGEVDKLNNQLSEKKTEIEEYEEQIKTLNSSIATLSAELESYRKPEDGNEEIEVENKNTSGVMTDLEIAEILSQEVIQADANTIVSLYKENSNDVAIETKYHKKHLTLTGKVKSISGNDEYSEVTLDNDELESFIGIECRFDSNTSKDIIANLNVGDYITIEGVGYDSGFTFKMYGCTNITNIQSGNTSVGMDGATTGERNALKSAQSYLDLFSFSRKQLIEQLEWEGYSQSEIEYALNGVGY